MQNDHEARLSIVAYKPKPGHEEELLELTREHVPFLRSIGCATERQHVIAKAGDGTIIEVFEWTEGGLEKAHGHAELGKMWSRYSAACDYVPLASLAEAGGIFANFLAI